MALGESTSLEVEECISAETMYLARVSSLDVVGGDLESRDSTDTGIFSDEDIGLIDANIRFSVGFIDFRHSLDRDDDVVGGDGEDIECRSGSIAHELSRYRSTSTVYTDTCRLECRSFADRDMSSIVSSTFWQKTIRNLDTFFYGDSGIEEFARVDDVSIFIDASIRIYEELALHRASVAKMRRIAIHFIFQNILAFLTYSRILVSITGLAHPPP